MTLPTAEVGDFWSINVGKKGAVVFLPRVALLFVIIHAN